jgi:hypothetical protein
MGRSVVETPTDVRLQHPAEAAQAEELLGDVISDGEGLPESSDDSESLADTAFHLERQLQEFIADNLKIHPRQRQAPAALSRRRVGRPRIPREQ